jgi:hypothetical protein
LRIYVASSWRNYAQVHVVRELRRAGHDVYDFKNPLPGNHGFSWRQIVPDPRPWAPALFGQVMDHPIAQEALRLDSTALREAEGTVLVMPCGSSAHLELGVAIGLGQRTAVLLSDQPAEPELMVGMADLLTTEIDDVLALFASPVRARWNAAGGAP